MSRLVAAGIEAEDVVLSDQRQPCNDSWIVYQGQWLRYAHAIWKEDRARRKASHWRRKWTPVGRAKAPL